ncbi:GDP-mannose 4,6-dehydratase [Pyruvatibacter mobilis]|uniref:GDP-mannose 4,6-dehydratase n=1 Tax=Pyruvatibacter mobilis TaxID=1712261 RepID=UPI003D12DC89
MPKKTAFITGITGQDGGYLAKLLLDRGYDVHGLQRRTSSSTVGKLYEVVGADRARDEITMHTGDMTDGASLVQALKACEPDEVYNLAAQSHVKVSFEKPEYTSNVNAMGTLRLLEAIRLLGMGDHVRFYQASTSELYGNVQEMPQSETTPFQPRSPYAISKHHAFLTTVNYREAYGFHASNGILFNHEGPTRGEDFVSRKITIGVARIHKGLSKSLSLGNLDAKRDWGHVRDYVEGMWLMQQQEQASDYVLATGEDHSVREFAELAFRHVGREIEWSGIGVDEKGRDAKSGDILVEVNPQFFRPAEVNSLLGNPGKARDELGWEPKVTFTQLVSDMINSDLARVSA